MYLKVSFGDTDQKIMFLARAETSVLSQALAKNMVIVQSFSFFIVYTPMSVDKVYSVT